MCTKSAWFIHLWMTKRSPQNKPKRPSIFSQSINHRKTVTLISKYPIAAIRYMAVDPNQKQRKPMSEIGVAFPKDIKEIVHMNVSLTPAWLLFLGWGLFFSWWASIIVICLLGNVSGEVLNPCWALVTIFVCIPFVFCKKDRKEFYKQH